MNDAIAELVKLDGWHAERAAARVHYDGATTRYAIEYYAESESVLYWSVPVDDVNDNATDTTAGSEIDNTNGTTTGHMTAAPIPRTSVPMPLRKRIRQDLTAAGIDPSVERRKI